MSENSRRLAGAPQGGIARRVRRSVPYYVLILIPLIILLVFKYYPMYGVTLAFKDYKVSAGIAGSPWTEPLFRHFTRFLTAPSAVRVITNTLIISLYSLLAGFPFRFCWPSGSMSSTASG